MDMIKTRQSGRKRAFTAALPCVIAATFLFASPVGAQHGRELTALTTLQSGQWALRGLDAASPSKSLCVGDLQALLRIAHPKATCTQTVITDSNSQAVVYYSCPGIGHAQTSIKIETPRLIQIDSQGVSGNEPFAFSYEARRTGDCAVASLAHPR